MPIVNDTQRAAAVTAKPTTAPSQGADASAVLAGVSRTTAGLEAPVDREVLDGVMDLVASEIAGRDPAAGTSGTAGPGTMTQLERKEAIVAAWSKNWGPVMPKMDAETHQRLAAEYGAQIAARQKEIAPSGGEVARTLHRKGVFAARAHFTVSPDIPEALRFGPFATPGGKMEAVVRLSNASGKSKGDDEKDLRGLAVRLTSGGKIQDLLATSFPASHAKDTDDFIAATALLKGLGGAGELFSSMPPWDAARMLGFLRKTMSTSDSVAKESYWSRSHFQLGDRLVEFRWVPEDTGAPTGTTGDDALRDDMVARVKRGPVKWSLEMRGFLDESRTPVDDGRKEWTGPWIKMGGLEIPPDPNMSSAKADGAIDMVESLGFSISNRWEGGESSLKGRGILNEFREEAYAASHEGRGTEGAKARACPLGFG